MELVRSIVVFNHSVDKGELQETIPENFQGDIIIHGNLMYDYLRVREEICNFDISGNLWVDGNVDMEDCFLNVHGDFVCTGFVVAKELSANNIECIGELRVRRRLVADDIFCDALNAYIVNVSGDVVCNSSQIDTMNVYGNYICFKKSRIEGASIYGNCICDGDISTVCIMVSQNLMCAGIVDAFDLSVLGNAKVAHKLSCEDVNVKGTLEISTPD